MKAAAVGFSLVVLAVLAFALLRTRYTFALQSPVRLRFQWPVAMFPRVKGGQPRGLTEHQTYACRKFGAACPVALAIQKAENGAGACEAFHYNTDGSLDWGYFQINTVHLQRRGVHLRDLLDCEANIDFAYQLYTERGFAPWSTYNSGAYRKFLE